MGAIASFRHRTPWMRVVACGAMLLVTTAAPWRAAFGDDDSSTTFGALAAADGIRVRVSSASLAVVPDIVDGGGPTAQAEVNSLGTSQGFASAPYPGETVRSVPGLIGVATGQSVPVTYPFVATSSHPTAPDGRVEQPGYVVSSHSEASKSTSSAVLGRRSDDGSGSAVASDVLVERAGQAVTAEARTTVQAFVAGPVRIAGFTSESTARRSAADGKVNRKASSSAAVFNVGDIAVGLTDHGVVLGGTNIPAETFAPVRDTLKQAGVTVRFVESVQTDDGIVAPGLEVTRPIDMPGGGQVLVTYTLGRAAAFATLGGTAPAVPVDPVPSLGTDPTSAAVPDSPIGGTPPLADSVPGSAAVAPAGASIPAFGTTLPAGPGTVVAGDVSASAPVAPAEPVEPGGGFALSSTPPRGTTMSSWGLYPITVLAGAVLVVAAQLRRLLAGK